MSEKEDPVAKDHTKITGMVAILVVVFLIIISAFGVANDPKPLEHPDAWYVYIVRFQTLIGGLLAVGAAFITVRQMRRSDQQADKRHRDLMQLQLRPIIEARTNLKTKYQMFFRILIERLDEYTAMLENYVQQGENYKIGSADHLLYGAVFDVIDAMNKKLHEKDWADDRDALSGQDRATFDMVRVHLDILAKQLVFEEVTLSDGTVERICKHLHSVEQLVSLQKDLVVVSTLIGGLCDRLDGAEEI